LEKKICNRFFFFKTRIDDIYSIGEVEPDDVSGYCVVHQDSVDNLDPDRSFFDPEKSYLTECIINSLLLCLTLFGPDRPKLSDPA
jgi:hypothetical protein